MLVVCTTNLKTARCGWTQRATFVLLTLPGCCRQRHIHRGPSKIHRTSPRSNKCVVGVVFDIMGGAASVCTSSWQLHPNSTETSIPIYNPFDDMKSGKLSIPNSISRCADRRTLPKALTSNTAVGYRRELERVDYGVLITAGNGIGKPTSSIPC
jgi:hypothetical protein